MANKQKADPRMHLRALQKTEEELVKKLKPKEKEIRQLIEELKALRELIKATGKQVQEYDSEIEDEKDLESKKTIENLEEVITQSSAEVSKTQTGNISDQYASVSAKNLSVAANIETITNLYDLAYKSSWSQKDAENFFNMQYAINKTRDYQESISDVFKERVDDTYKALQQVWDRAKEQIKNNYTIQEGLIQKSQHFENQKQNSASQEYNKNTFQTMPNVQKQNIQEQYKPNPQKK